MAPWSRGQDASLSRWNQGFDSPRSHLKSPFLRAFFVSEKERVMDDAIHDMEAGRVQTIEEAWKEIDEIESPDS